MKSPSRQDVDGPLRTALAPARPKTFLWWMITQSCEGAVEVHLTTAMVTSHGNQRRRRSFRAVN